MPSSRKPAHASARRAAASPARPPRRSGATQGLVGPGPNERPFLRRVSRRDAMRQSTHDRSTTARRRCRRATARGSHQGRFGDGPSPAPAEEPLPSEPVNAEPWVPVRVAPVRRMGRPSLPRRGLRSRRGARRPPARSLPPSSESSRQVRTRGGSSSASASALLRRAAEKAVDGGRARATRVQRELRESARSGHTRVVARRARFRSAPRHSVDGHARSETLVSAARRRAPLASSRRDGSRRESDRHST